MRDIFTHYHLEHFPAGVLPTVVVDSRGRMWFDSEAPPNGATLLLHRHGRVAALLTYFYPHPRKMKLLIAWVSPSLRRRGVASRLLQHLIDIEKPPAITADAITQGGLGLMESLERSTHVPVTCLCVYRRLRRRAASTA